MSTQLIIHEHIRKICLHYSYLELYICICKLNVNIKTVLYKQNKTQEKQYNNLNVQLKIDYYTPINDATYTQVK